MKKIILTMMACAGLCACTNEEIVGTGGTTAADELGGPVAYLTVNIKDVGSSTRAKEDGFAYGTTDEQAVANAYFYFYDADGKYMARGSVASVSGTASPGDTPGNIEWSSNTVVAVYGLTSDVDDNGKPVSLPTKMVTVLNQPDGFSGINKDLGVLMAELAQATNGYADGSTNAHFVMSTSSYDAGSTTGIVNYTPLTADDFRLEPISSVDSDYSDGGVPVYVERLAAKVSVSNGITDATTTEYGLYNLTDVVKNEFADNSEPSYVGVKLLGWDINGTSRDSYMLKNISDDSSWSGLTFTWNDANDYRSYWAESPNYGVGGYPTSSVKEGKTVGNTDDDEADASTWLNEYLKYTSLNSPIAIGSYGYCAENTNTVDVLGDASSTGITNVLVKAQAYTTNDNDEYVPLDLVKYHGMYYTADGFCQKTVADVVEYDFTVLVDEVIAAMKDKYPDLATYLDDLNACIIKDNVYVTKAVPYHLPNGHNVDGNVAPTIFDGSLLSLYNIGDGNVDLFFNMTTPPQWGDCEFTYDRTTGEITSYEPNFTAINDGIMDNYPESAIVYGGADLDDYEFWFEVEEEGLGTLELLGLTDAGVIFQIDGWYYMALSNNFSFTTENTGDPNFTGNHTYTLRNYLLRAITVEADGIDKEFGSLYPVLYKNGLMYYSIPIEHLGTTTGDLVEGQYGVVRNHWYNITLNSISDLGHGIADENEVIVPQPELDYYYLGATVNILSWRMIKQSASLK